VTVFPHSHMPALGGATEWLNSEPLGPAELQGRVVVVNFWTLTCINWLRQEPYVRAWSEAYRGDGLIVLGVHTPEFSFEHEVERVRRATKERAIDYPVVVDNDYAIWSAFANHYWPALYFVDAEGIIRGEHFGEGRCEHSERVIQRLLGVERELATVQGLGVEAEADWDHLRSPETYLGYGRSGRFASPTAPRLTDAEPTRCPDAWTRTTGRSPATGRSGPRRSCSKQAAGASSSAFDARDAHLVLSSGVREPIPFGARLDGEAPGRSHGVDVDEDGNGMLPDGRLYQLIRQYDGAHERTLEITFLAPGAEAYSFTFG
jgi:thiol-disulfide isomerase/thioredoxin